MCTGSLEFLEGQEPASDSVSPQLPKRWKVDDTYARLPVHEVYKIEYAEQPPQNLAPRKSNKVATTEDCEDAFVTSVSLFSDVQSNFVDNWVV